MAYVQPNTLSQKASTLGVVAALHAAAFVALLNGLGVAFNPPETPPRIWGDHFPLPTPTPTPIPKASPSQTPPTDRERFVPPPVGGLQPAPLATGKPFGEEGVGGGTLGGTGDGEIDIPDPIPDPTPSFAPRGPRTRGEPGRWVTNDDYPSREATLDHEGLTRVRLGVGTNGRVTDCAVTASSGWPTLDQATCTWLTRRARFDPATDSAGEVTTGSYNTSVRWRLPDE